jgi:hypothetical protein
MSKSESAPLPPPPTVETGERRILPKRVIFESSAAISATGGGGRDRRRDLYVLMALIAFRRDMLDFVARHLLPRWWGGGGLVRG